MFIFFLIATSFTRKDEGVLLHFENKTGQDLKTLMVNIRGKEFHFTDLKNNTSSKPVAADGTYKFFYAKAVAGNDTLVTPGFCKTGEVVIKEGSYTFTLSRYHTKEMEKYLQVEMKENRVPE